MAASGNRPVLQALRGSLTNAAITSTLLLVPAGLVPGGTWLWPRGIAFVIAYVAVNAIGDLVLAAWRPAHFQVRQQSVVASREKRQPLIDAVGSAGLLAVGAAWLASIPLDVFTLHVAPPPPAWLAWTGGAISMFGVALTPIAVWENRFATPNVQQQGGQAIVRTGVYRLVRHPIYLGNLLMTAGAALWLGSYAGLWGFGVLLLATIARIWLEERELRARLPEYADYARRVRARLVPFLI